MQQSNEWEVSDKLLISYPKVAGSHIAPLSPLGCWDLWDYTSDIYATSAGPRLLAIKVTMDALAAKEI